MPLGEVVGGPQSCLSFGLFMEIQTGNSLYLLWLVLWVMNNLISLFKFQKAGQRVTHCGGCVLANMHLCVCMLEVRILHNMDYLILCVMWTCPLQKLYFWVFVCLLSPHTQILQHFHNTSRIWKFYEWSAPTIVSYGNILMQARFYQSWWISLWSVKQRRTKCNHINRIMSRMQSSSVHSSLLNTYQRGY